MKKIFVVAFLIVTLMLILCACGKKEVQVTPTQVSVTGAPKAETIIETTVPAAEISETVVETEIISTEKEVLKASTELTQDEQELITLVGEDLNVVDDSIFAEIVPELVYHVGEFSGQVYMLEGVLHQHGDELYLGRTLKNGDEETEIKLPMRYLTKEIPDDAWVSVTGIVNSENGATILDIIAIEAKAEPGTVVLEWSGHNH